MTRGMAPQLTAHELALRGEVGFLHSEQTGSALDGPGLRTVFFLSGCVMRCQYCHNPDTWKLHAGRRVRASELVDEALKYEEVVSIMDTIKGLGKDSSGNETNPVKVALRQPHVECKVASAAAPPQ